ncbi:unnamed protein product [Brassica napus]|uniref:(rape) hypothetical protein n=1 Tax=Brassica napus TaxID=3708 RepID=A0A816ZU32_BRANA|nr:unnamed protein product [Brassica napus]
MPGHSLSSYSYASAMSAAPHRLSLSSSTSSLFLIATPDIETKQWKIDGQSESIKQHSDSITLIYKVAEWNFPSVKDAADVVIATMMSGIQRPANVWNTKTLEADRQSPASLLKTGIHHLQAFDR